MSRYRIEVARQAEKAILKLPPQVQRRVRDAVRALADDPRPRGARQLEDWDWEDAWRIRVGDYRVIYEIRDVVLVVLIVRVAHRREAYRRR